MDVDEAPARVMDGKLQLQSLREGWGWYEETCAQLGEPTSVTADDTKHLFSWKTRTEDGERFPSIRVEADLEDDVWYVNIDNIPTFPDVTWECFGEPSTEDMLMILTAARFFELRAYIVREDEEAARADAHAHALGG